MAVAIRALSLSYVYFFAWFLSLRFEYEYSIIPLIHLWRLTKGDERLSQKNGQKEYSANLSFEKVRVRIKSTYLK